MSAIQVPIRPAITVVTFEVPGVLMSRANHHGHWSALAAHDHDWFTRTVGLGLQARQLAGWGPAGPDDRRSVEIIIYRNRLLDPDNADAAVKPIRDGLKLRHTKRLRRPNKNALPIPAHYTDLWGAGLTFNDNPDRNAPNLGRPLVTQCQAPKFQQRVKIIVRAL